MNPDVVIVGGGLSGLSAAVNLSRAGLSVNLLESRHILGGRASSFVDHVTGDVVDNGQHLMLGCYHATRRYLTDIGADHLVELQPSLELSFVKPGSSVARLSCPRLPAPAHIAAGLLALKTLSWKDRMALARVGHALIGLDPQSEQHLDQVTVREWLTGLGQSPNVQEVLWDVLAIGSLNDDPKRVSALLFARVLKAAFFGGRGNSSFLVPRAGLSEVFGDGARRFIESRGGRVLMGVRVAQILHDGRSVSGVSCIGHPEISARLVICAVPFYAVTNLLAPELITRDGQVRLERFRSSAIISVNLWLDREVMRELMVACLGMSTHWVFNRTAMLGGHHQGQHLCAVTSGASELAHRSNRELIALTMDDLARVFPEAQAAVVRRALVIKEKRATFSPLPGLERFRPSARTALRGCYLAGDWTSTGYPATIEGAVLSGREAARAVLEDR